MNEIVRFPQLKPVQPELGIQVCLGMLNKAGIDCCRIFKRGPNSELGSFTKNPSADGSNSLGAGTP